MKKYFYFLLTLLVFAFHSVVSQPAGLQFGSHESLIDQRTGLKLMDGKKLNVNEELELTVDVFFNRSPKHYFGYILRIIDDSHRNIDIVYNYKSKRFNDFSIIYDHQLTPIKFNYKDRRNALNKKWRKLKFKLDVKNNEISLSLDDRTYSYKVENGISPMKGLKFYFGANNNPYFKAHDVPPMTLKNLQITSDNTGYTWPLDEKEGEVAHCKENPEYNGKVMHPIWVKQTHSKWDASFNETIQSGLYSFLENGSGMYFVKDKNLYRHDFQTSETKKVGPFAIDLKSDVRNRLVKNGNKLLVYNLKKDFVYSYDIKSQKFEKFSADYPISQTATHHAQWFDKDNKSIMIFGGYGNHEFNSHFTKYDIEKNNYTDINVTGDKITPRYYTGVGYGKKGHVYLFGGYGSVSGQQIINPENFYDLYEFNENTSTLKKVFTWDTPSDSFVSARSVVVDTTDNQLYALTFDNHKFKNEITLRNYDLASGEMKVFPVAIPFNFSDLKTVVDLTFDTQYQKLYAILIEKVGVESQIKVFSLNLMGGFYIPELPKETAEIVAVEDEPASWNLVLFMATFSLLMVGVVIWRKSRKTIEDKTEESPQTTTVIEKTESVSSDVLATKEEPKPKSEPVVETVTIEEPVKAQPPKVKKSTINFFGGFRIFDSSGKDISNEFTPLIKQLFILITISQYINGRGVSADKMIKLFWYDMPLSKARNNRGVNLTKLRRLCKTIGEVKFLKDADFWKLEIGEEVNIPFFELKELLVKPQSRETLLKILEILDTGKLLLGTDYEWMEEMKAEIVNHLIETLYGYLTSSEVKLSNQEKLKISDTILQYDHIHEEATLIKCQLLSSQGMHSVAKDIFNKFKDEYESIYDEKFDMHYNEFLREMGNTY
ncbi:hypothetical protein [Flammeovirga sp. SubArs3]|uniref:Kelch repeat-containing protein n=1 Tax=Flammeovirga sp. SubArs3 TaxID=2995316 RepID=UPI00248C17C9|nr:hypothetical protein [Flammeovirga sp. SubArs3]